MLRTPGEAIQPQGSRALAKKLGYRGGSPSKQPVHSGGGGSPFPPLPPADAMLLLLPPLSLPKAQGPDLELWNTRAFQQFQEPAGSTEERQRQLDWARPFCFRGAIYVLYKDGVWKNRKGLENVVTIKKGQIRRHFR